MWFLFTKKNCESVGGRFWYEKVAWNEGRKRARLFLLREKYQKLRKGIIINNKSLTCVTHFHDSIFLLPSFLIPDYLNFTSFFLSQIVFLNHEKVREKERRKERKKERFGRLEVRTRCHLLQPSFSFSSEPIRACLSLSLSSASLRLFWGKELVRSHFPCFLNSSSSRLSLSLSLSLICSLPARTESTC